MNPKSIIKTAGALSVPFILGAAPALQAGIQHVSAAGVAPSECDGCINPGFYASASALYLHSYNSELDEFEGDWDTGFRGVLGWQSHSGLDFALTGFYHETDWSAIGEDTSVVPPVNVVTPGDFEFFYLDGTIGDTIHCGELCVSVAGGLRYTSFEFNEDWGGMVNNSSFEGIGPVFALNATRAMNERCSLYADFRQSLVFGESDFNGFEADTLASITEIGAGVQVNFGVGSITDAFVRLGVEGQYWHVDAASVGLFGGVFTVGANF